MKKILVIENERMVFLDIKITFTKLGYEVIHGSKHNIGLVAESIINPDLIIMDIVSVMNIEGVLKLSLSNYSKFKDVPVILTTTCFKSSIKFCVKNRINLIGELYKPYEANGLVAIYHAFLRSRVNGVPQSQSQEYAFAY